MKERPYVAGEDWGQVIAWGAQGVIANVAGSRYRPRPDDPRLEDLGLILDRLGSFIPPGAREVLRDLAPLGLPLLVAALARWE